MAGRRSMPVDLILLNGNKDRKTKEELRYRKAKEQSLYTGFPFHESAQVKSNPMAHKEFLRLRKLYKMISYIDGLDEQIINRYCMQVAEAYALQGRLEKLDAELENCEEFEDRMKIFEMQNKMQAAMNKDKELLLKYEDRLFLNPAGRMRSIPKSPKKEPAAGGVAGYRAQRRADA